MSKIKLTVLLSVFIVVIDQILKLSVNPQVLNSGFFLGTQLPSGVLAIVHVSIVVGGVYFVFREKPEFGEWYLLLLLVSLSNLVDRLRLGAVVDYLNFMGIWFNLSDAIISLVLIIIVLRLVKDSYAGIHRK